MGESFKEYSCIQDFEADFPQKVSLKILNLTDYYSISHLLSISPKTIDNLNWKYWYLVGIMQVLTFEILKFRIYESLNFHPCF